MKDLQLQNERDEFYFVMFKKEYEDTVFLQPTGNIKGRSARCQGVMWTVAN